MKVQKTVAIAFLVALGFAKAETWDDEKIIDRLKQAPEKVAEGEAPEGHEELLKGLRAAKGAVTLEDSADAKPPKDEKKSEKPPKEKPEAAPKAKKTENPPKAKDSAPKPPKDKSAKPAKPAGTKKPTNGAVDRDEFGCRKGSISAKVNAKVNDEWQSEAEIAKAAGVTLDQARGRLYYGAEKAVFEHRRMIQYRLVPKEPAAKEKA